MHIILAPVDGSIHSVKAVHIACDLCDKYGGKIVLCHNLLSMKNAKQLLDLKIVEMLDQKTVIALRHLAAATPPKSLPHELVYDFGATVLRIAEKQVERRGFEAQVLDIYSGDPAENILTAAKLVNANTIVMGCRGVTSSKPGHFGSVSQKVFAEASCTCIAVK